MNRRSFFSRLAISLVSVPAIARAITSSRTLWFDGQNDYLKTATWNEGPCYLSGVSGNYVSTPDTSNLTLCGDFTFTFIRRADGQWERVI